MTRFTSFERFAAEFGPEDGTDPRRFFDRRRPCDSHQAPTRKAWQLCRQVQKELSLILASCADPLLGELQVVSVEPAPHSGRLRVLVTTNDDSVSRREREMVLVRATGWLRQEVATAICRRRTPELVIELV